ncbi:MAG: peptidoglycan-binding domain-containing protein [Chthoniobacterales bacterium]
MKRFLAVVLAMGFFVVAATADDNLRAVQAKLKEGGFYFGKVDGAPSSELSAAMTRYQIRNGLEITGKLDPKTSRALGVKAETNIPAADSETWRRLRKTDQQFIERARAAQKAQSPVAPRKNAIHEPRTRALEPVDESGSRLILSRERLRDYVAAFVLAGLDPHVGAELEFFADRVRYYDDGIVGREKIRRDLQRYDAQWPQRRFRLAGEVNVEPQPDSRLRVTFPLRYELRNGAKHSSGTVRKTLILEVVGEDLQIVGVNERRGG